MRVNRRGVHCGRQNIAPHVVAEPDGGFSAAINRWFSAERAFGRIRPTLIHTTTDARLRRRLTASAVRAFELAFAFQMLKSRRVSAVKLVFRAGG